MDDEIPDLIDTERTPVPLTILTGYLGSGKSTLLKRILDGNHQKKIAVIMNEFGDTNDIETKAISIASESDERTEFVELANGCICCSVRGAGLIAVQELVQRNPDLDRIILETSGLADPAPLMQSFWVDPSEGLDVALDSVICLVDAKHIARHLVEKRDGRMNEAQRQVACGDVIVLNKVDVASQQDVQQAKDLLRTVNMAAPIIDTVRCDFNYVKILGLNSFSGAQAAIRLPEQLWHECCADSPHGHRHDLDITSIAVDVPQRVDLEQLDALVRDITWNQEWPVDASPKHSVDIHRMKGYLTDADGHAHILQGVEDMYEWIPAQGDESIKKRLIFIGRGLSDSFEGYIQVSVTKMRVN